MVKQIIIKNILICALKMSSDLHWIHCSIHSVTTKGVNVLSCGEN